MPSKIRDLRNAKGLYQKDLASLVGVSINTVRRWESGERDPRGKDLATLASVLNVSTDYLMGREEIKKEAPSQETGSPGEAIAERTQHNGVHGDRTIFVPVYEDLKSACAGRGTEAETMEGVVKELLEIPRWIIPGPISTDPDKYPFIVTVYGDSMIEASIADGSKLLVNPIAEANDGDVIIAQLNGDWMVKWIYWDRRGEGGELRSSSIKYPSRHFTREDIDSGYFRYIGKVIMGLTSPQKGA